MHKSGMEHRWEETKIRQSLNQSAKEEKIPESLLPSQMERWLLEQSSKSEEKGEEPMEKRGNDSKQEPKSQRKHGKYFGWWCGTFAACACLALILFAAGRNMDWELGAHKNNSETARQETAGKEENADSSTDTVESAGEEAEEKGGTKIGTTYEKLYNSFDKVWKEQEKLYKEVNALDQKRETAKFSTDGAAPTKEAAEAVEDINTDTAVSGAAEPAEGGAADQSADTGQGTDTADYGKTNQQEEEVEEADIIKNDGRYLYQVVYQQKDDKNVVRIVDTKGGLKEAALVGSFQTIQDIYIWKDKLVILEPGWAEQTAKEETTVPETEEAETEEPEKTEYSEEDSGGLIGVIRDMAADILDPRETVVEDEIFARTGYAYCKIHIYDISDRSNPKEYHTFTIKGSYMDSRISDGYLYFFSTVDAFRPEKQIDYKAYVPTFDDQPMPEDKIFLPQEADEASYLVMASVDMEHPDQFIDTQALVTSADKFYVSQSNIYVADMQYNQYDGQEGKNTDSTNLYRYSYRDGRMYKEAEGSVKGTLQDDMAMNEYQGHLRMVTTVESQNVEQITDDISDEIIGFDTSSIETTNSLYILDENLKVTGKIENLAKDERVYSARFMGDIGYFVTFRETDPLFSVDLSNPAEPKILGELKISGFSEYLHFYAENLLLGIGMEADENTGRTDGMKLSMFDISNPVNVKEQSKLNMEYDYSDALYNYKAVLIDTKKNLFGFSAEAYSKEYQKAYLLFTYENGEFRQIMKIDCSDEERYGWSLRGTYIKDRFFLLAENGLIEEYSLADGSKTAELEAK